MNYSELRTKARELQNRLNAFPGDQHTEDELHVVLSQMREIEHGTPATYDNSAYMRRRENEHLKPVFRVLFWFAAIVLIVALFWLLFGTFNDETTKHTEQEPKAQHAAKKPAVLYIYTPVDDWAEDDSIKGNMKIYLEHLIQE